MKRVLEITLVPTSEDTFDVEIYEPESGDFNRIECHDKGDTLDAENKKIIEELRSWVSLMREDLEDECEVKSQRLD